jgi:hypothetical protein
MIRFSQAVLVAILLSCAPFALACDYPARTDVPNGNSATKDEMIQGQRNVKSYMAAMEDYLACIESAEQETVAGNDDLDEEQKQQRIAMFNKKYNAAVEEMNLVAEQFNSQVRAYKDRDK